MLYYEWVLKYKQTFTHTLTDAAAVAIFTLKQSIHMQIAQ